MTSSNKKHKSIHTNLIVKYDVNNIICQPTHPQVKKGTIHRENQSTVKFDDQTSKRKNYDERGK